MGRTGVAALWATIGAVVAAGAVGLVGSRSERLAAVSVAVPAAAARAPAPADCRRLHARLPRHLGADVSRRPVTPSSDRTAAWGEPPVVLRCGVPMPVGFTLGVQPLVIDDVSWYQHINGDTVQWTTVDRPVYVEVEVPVDYPGQAGFLVSLAPALKHLPQVPIEPGPPRSG